MQCFVLNINYSPKTFFLYSSNNLLYCFVNLFSFRSINNNFILNNIFIFYTSFHLISVYALLSFMKKKVMKETRKGLLKKLHNFDIFKI